MWAECAMGKRGKQKRNPQADTLHPVKGGESRSTAFLPYLDLRSVSIWQYSRNDYRVKCLMSSMKPSPDAGSTCRSASSGPRRGWWGNAFKAPWEGGYRVIPRFKTDVSDAPMMLPVTGGG